MHKMLKKCNKMITLVVKLDRHVQQQQRRDVNHGSLNRLYNGVNSKNMLG